MGVDINAKLVNNFNTWNNVCIGQMSKFYQ